jgi:hypothetical protein
MDVEAEAPEDTAWEFDAGGDVVPGTGGDGWRTYSSDCILGFSGSYECYQDETPADFSPGTEAVIELYVDRDAGASWVGTAVCGGIHPEAPIDGMETVSVDFQGVLNLNVKDSTTTS